MGRRGAGAYNQSAFKERVRENARGNRERDARERNRESVRKKEIEKEVREKNSCFCKFCTK